MPLTLQHIPDNEDLKYVVTYESDDDVRTKAPIHFPAHKARWEEFRARGERLMIGTFSDLSGAMGVFTSRESAEAFVKDDPFVLHGVVRGDQIREWNEAITAP
jgi:uncharacterized protein YciI